MASDIIFNGTKYPDGGLGTYFRNVQPPPFSGTNTPTLFSDWGSRLAVMSGRVRGLSGIGTLNINIGFLDIVFPSTWFNYIPIVGARFQHPLEKTQGDAKSGIVDYQYIHPAGAATPYIINKNSVLKLIAFDTVIHSNMKIVGISNCGFSIHYNTAIYGSQWKYPTPTPENGIVIFWHAFGL